MSWVLPIPRTFHIRLRSNEGVSVLPIRVRTSERPGLTAFPPSNMPYTQREGVACLDASDGNGESKVGEDLLITRAGMGAANFSPVSQLGGLTWTCRVVPATEYSGSAFGFVGLI